MEQTLQIKGMTCDSCVDKVKTQLARNPYVLDVKVQLDAPQAILLVDQPIDISILKNELKFAGNYSIIDDGESETVPQKSINTYTPLILVVLFITGASTLAQFSFETFDINIWMRHFMAGFFIAFSFFKFLNLKGFANSYAMYDIIAARWKGWGYIYPFLELGLGIMFFLGVELYSANLGTIILLGIGTIGVIESNLNKRKIKCACLGDIFNLPMSVVTIVENVVMIVMAVLMIT